MDKVNRYIGCRARMSARDESQHRERTHLDLTANSRKLTNYGQMVEEYPDSMYYFGEPVTFPDGSMMVKAGVTVRDITHGHATPSHGSVVTKPVQGTQRERRQRRTNALSSEVNRNARGWYWPVLGRPEAVVDSQGVRTSAAGHPQQRWAFTSSTRASPRRSRSTPSTTRHINARLRSSLSKCTAEGCLTASFDDQGRRNH